MGDAPFGRLTLEEQRGTLTFERLLAAPLQAVWAALTEPARFGEWFANGRIEPRAGGRIVLWEGLPGQETTGRILVWDAPRVLEHEWRFEGESESVLRYELAAQGDETRLTVTHRALGQAFAAPYLPGWHAHLDRLAAYVAGQPLPDWGERYAALAPRYKQ